ncbi:MAG: magnesium transporter, partial [Rhizobiales bacterium]|nr:magnesium transporter [Hyphomicrobiales bacterium]
MVDQADMTGAQTTVAFRADDGAILPEFRDRVGAAIQANDAAALRALTGELHEADTGDLIEALDAELRPRFVELMGREFDFTALTEVDDTVREEILEEVPARVIAEGVRDLDSDDAAYILEDLPLQEQEEILEQLPLPERGALEQILRYPEQSAGRRMQAEFIAVPPTWTVGRAIDHLRETDDLPDRFFELYVVDEAYKLLGAVGLDRLLRTKRPVPLSELMDPDRRRVRAIDDQEEVARMFERYNLVAAPVVDDSERLVGVVMVDDIVDVIEEEADEDMRALGGVTRHEELADSVWTIARARFPWLLANMFTALIAASVIREFSSSIERMVALAVLMPVVASMGGNAGTQTMTVAVRALATRDLNDVNAWRVVRREMLVGLINGMSFAAILGVIAAGWFHITDLGLVIGLAMVCVLTAAAIGGIVIPLTLIRFGIDPALASGPFVTTVTDVVGF